MRTRRQGISMSGIALAAIAFVVATAPLFSQGDQSRDTAAAREQAIAALKARSAIIEEHPKSGKEPAWMSVDLGFTQVTDEGIAPLNALADLRKLYLHNAKVSGAGLQAIKDLDNLEALYLQDCPAVDDQGLKHIAGLTKLKILILGGCPLVSNKGLAHLKGLTALEELDVSGTDISDEGLKQLSVLRNLKSLNLDASFSHRSEITDAGVKHLEPLAKLERLSLLDAKITDAAAGSLAKLTALKHLNLHYCRTVSPKGLDELHKALPECEIER